MLRALSWMDCHTHQRRYRQAVVNAPSALVARQETSTKLVLHVPLWSKITGPSLPPSAVVLHLDMTGRNR